MPSGGYGLDPDDGQYIKAFLDDAEMQKYGLTLEWFWAYATARGAGATPQQAAIAAYAEWDL